MPIGLIMVIINAALGPGVKLLKLTLVGLRAGAAFTASPIDDKVWQTGLDIIAALEGDPNAKQSAQDVKAVLEVIKQIQDAVKK